MKRAVLSKPIYPADAYREDYEMLTEDGKTPAQEDRDRVTMLGYVLVYMAAMVLACVVLWAWLFWRLF